jgi:hypothetical protein
MVAVRRIEDRVMHRNSQPEGQPEMCPTSGYYQVLGSPQQPFDTVEVWGSSPHGPTIYFNNIRTLSAFCVAPHCSNKSLSHCTR